MGAVNYVMVCVCLRDERVYPSGLTKKSGTRETGAACYQQGRKSGSVQVGTTLHFIIMCSLGPQLQSVA